MFDMREPIPNILDTKIQPGLVRESIELSEPVKALYPLANIDWAFHIFWAIYFSIIICGVTYVIG